MGTRISLCNACCKEYHFPSRACTAYFAARFQSRFLEPSEHRPTDAMNLRVDVIFFWFSLMAIVHTYALFPLLIAIWAGIRNSTSNEPKDINHFLPSVTVLFAAYNEERSIRERIENLALCTYPKEKMTVLVGSDGCSDATDRILRELSARYSWLHVVYFAENRGKAEVLNTLFPLIASPYTVFTDADTVFSLDSVEKILLPFQDPSVGCVAGLRLVRSQAAATVTEQQESSYLDLDNRIRQAEGKLGCVIGAHGSLFAVRTDLIRPLPTGKAFTDDFYWSVIPLELGYTVVQSMHALSYAESAPSTSADFRRKIRYASTAFATCFRFMHLLWSGPAAARYAFFSHRVSRWFLPFFLLAAFFGNVALANEGMLYALLLGAQFLMYAAAMIGIIFPGAGRVSGVFSLSAYFVYSNAALLLGFFRWISGRASQRWTPVRQ